MIEVTNELEAAFAIAQLTTNGMVPMLVLDAWNGGKVRWFGKCIPRHVRYALNYLTDKPEEYVQEIRAIKRGKQKFTCSECGRRPGEHFS